MSTAQTQAQPTNSLLIKSQSPYPRQLRDGLSVSFTGARPVPYVAWASEAHYTFSTRQQSAGTRDILIPFSQHACFSPKERT